MELWISNGKSVVEKLKQRSLAPKQVRTKLHMMISIVECTIILHIRMMATISVPCTYRYRHQANMPASEHHFARLL